MADDEAVKGTSDEAALCKRYASEKGYWKDDFIRYFCSKPGRKSPEISRGYYARVVAIETVLRQFLTLCHKSGRKCNVISFGAGSDTTFWRLHEWEWAGLAPGEAGPQPNCYIEVDFEDIVVRKTSIIKSKEVLYKRLQDASYDNHEIHSNNYHLIFGDLRKINDIGGKILKTGIDTNDPCFILAECVLVYMKPEFSSEVISWTGGTFPNSLFLIYDPISLNDGFGDIMKQNVKARGCTFYGLDSCPDLLSQKERFLSNHWSHAEASNMHDVYRDLPMNDRERIERIEFFDEKELLVQLLQHYCLSWGVNDSHNIGFSRLELLQTD